MRLLLFLSLMFICNAAFSQTYKRYWPNVGPQQPLYRFNLKDQVQKHQYDSLPHFETFMATLKKDGGVVYLPQDHMPCVVPPAVALGFIPNYWKPADSYRVWTTPNLSPPFRMDDLLK